MASKQLQDVAKALRRAKSVLLPCHERPDGDALGSSLGLCAALVAAGKKAVVVNPSGVQPNLMYLPGAKGVKTALPKAKFDLAVTTDSGAITRMGWDLAGMRKSGQVGAIVNLDHHKDNTKFGDLNYIDLKASSSAEVAYDVIKAAKLPVNKKVAMNLYTGIVTDTGSFRYSNTTDKTMRIATEMMSFGIKPFTVTEALEMSWPAERVAVIGAVLSTLERGASDKWALVRADRKTMLAHGDRYDLLDEIVNFPRSIGSVEVAIFFKEVAENDWRVSLRSKRYLDVGAIANAFGGGGHKFAAGLSLKGTYASVRNQLIEKVEAAL